MEFKKESVSFSDDIYRNIDGYVMKELSLFGIIKYKSITSGADHRYENFWSIIHIPSEKIFVDIFRTKREATRFLKIFWRRTKNRRLVLMFPDINIVTTELCEEIIDTFYEYGDRFA